MYFTVLGSGGCTSTPRPGCSCKICQEARVKGRPYARFGCALYARDFHALIDTPEDVSPALNAANVSNIGRIWFSHADPDHTMGLRVIEQLRLDWLAHSEGRRCGSPILVGSLPGVLADVSALRSHYGPLLDYYRLMGLIETEAFRELTVNGASVRLIPVDASGRVAVFLFSKNGKKLIYAPCDVKPFPKDEAFFGADCLVVGNTIVGDTLKGGFSLAPNNPLRAELFSMEEILEQNASIKSRT